MEPEEATLSTNFLAAIKALLNGLGSTPQHVQTSLASRISDVEQCVIRYGTRIAQLEEVIKTMSGSGSADQSLPVAGARSQEFQRVQTRVSCSEHPCAPDSSVLRENTEESHDDNDLYRQTWRNEQTPSAAARQNGSVIPESEGHQHQLTNTENAVLAGEGKSSTGKKATHTCEHCRKSFSCLSKMQTHLRIHTGERPYHCQYCDKSFNGSNDLQRHQHIHTGVKPYHCQYCDTSFRISGGLQRHQRIHTGVKPYHCQYCDTSFRTSDGLRRHQHIHTGVKPYHCQYCDKRFICSTSLKKHMSLHTGTSL